MTAIQNVHQNRLGFYPCDYETFLKVKKLQSFYWKALHRYAEYLRWVNKLPQNRVTIKWERNEKRQRIGFTVVGPRSEPKRYPLFTALRYVPKNCHALDDQKILADYANARTPKLTAEEVKPLKYTIDEIDRMISNLESFENSQK